MGAVAPDAITIPLEDRRPCRTLAEDPVWPLFEVALPRGRTRFDAVDEDGERLFAFLVHGDVPELDHRSLIGCRHRLGMRRRRSRDRRRHHQRARTRVQAPTGSGAHTSASHVAHPLKMIQWPEVRQSSA